MANRLPSVPLMHLNGPLSLWWELPQAETDPPHGWLRLSILHVLPDDLQAQWQPLDEEYTRRYAALYNEAKDEQADALRRQHEARWNEFYAKQGDFHFFFTSLDDAQSFATACIEQVNLALIGASDGVVLPEGHPYLCPQLALTFDTISQRSGLFGIGRSETTTSTLGLRTTDNIPATQPLNPNRVATQGKRLGAALTILGNADPAHLRDERAVAVVEQVVGAA